MACSAAIKVQPVPQNPGCLKKYVDDELHIQTAEQAMPRREHAAPGQPLTVYRTQANSSDIQHQVAAANFNINCLLACRVQSFNQKPFP